MQVKRANESGAFISCIPQGVKRKSLRGCFCVRVFAVTNYQSRLPCRTHDVTAAILVSQNNENAAMLVSQANPVFSYVKTFVYLFQYICIAAGHVSENALYGWFCFGSFANWVVTNRLLICVVLFDLFSSQDKQVGFALEAKPQTPLGLCQTLVNASLLRIKHFIKRLVRNHREKRNNRNDSRRRSRSR